MAWTKTARGPSTQLEWGSSGPRAVTPRGAGPRGLLDTALLVHAFACEIEDAVGGS